MSAEVKQSASQEASFLEILGREAYEDLLDGRPITALEFLNQLTKETDKLKKRLERKRKK